MTLNLMFRIRLLTEAWHLRDHSKLPAIYSFSVMDLNFRTPDRLAMMLAAWPRNTCNRDFLALGLAKVIVRDYFNFDSKVFFSPCANVSRLKIGFVSERQHAK